MRKKITNKKCLNFVFMYDHQNSAKSVKKGCSALTHSLKPMNFLHRNCVFWCEKVISKNISMHACIHTWFFAEVQPQHSHCDILLHKVVASAVGAGTASGTDSGLYIYKTELPYTNQSSPINPMNLWRWW